MHRQIHHLLVSLNNCNSLDDKTFNLIEKIGATIIGIKPATLINVSSQQCQNLCMAYRKLNEHIDIVLLKRAEGSAQAFVYHKKSLAKTLSAQDTARYLESLGYPRDCFVEDAVAMLVAKINSGIFPHEIGLFIGYPLKDVCGFMGVMPIPYRKTMGWKMYGDTGESEKLYLQFKLARNLVRNVLQQVYQ